MNVIFVLSLLLAFWSGFSLAKDQRKAVVYDLNQSQDLYAVANYLINSGNIRKSTLDQGRLMGSALNWKVMQTSLKDYLFPNKEEKKYKYEDYEEEDSEEEDYEREPYERPHYYPSQSYEIPQYYPSQQYFNNIPYHYLIPGYHYPAPYSKNSYYTPRKSEKSKNRLRVQYN